MKLKFTIIIATFFIGTQINAQQLPLSNLYNFNKYQLNPAYTGYNNCVEVNASRLNQWVGIEGAPITNYITAHSAFGKNMALGGGVILDKASFINRLSVRLSYAYRLKLGVNQNLRFGISGGMYQVQIDAMSAIADDANDEVISNGAQSGLAFDSEFGVWYNFKKFQFSLSIPQIFETTAGLDFASLDGFDAKRHLVIYSGYDFEINKNWNIEPSILYKNVKLDNAQLDANAMVSYKKFISLGLGYRTNVGLLAKMSLNIKNKYLLGYAYEFAGANISSFSSGSHEIMLGIKFCKKSNTAEIVDVNDPETLETEEEVVIEDTTNTTETTSTIEEEEVTEPIVVDDIEETIENNIVTEKEPVAEHPELKYKSDTEINTIEINFELGGTNNSNTAYSKLDDLAAYLQAHPDKNIEIKGHSCEIGNEEIKQKVSETRANTVKKYLTAKGVDSKRIMTKGMSDSETISKIQSENRRVTFMIK